MSYFLMWYWFVCVYVHSCYLNEIFIIWNILTILQLFSLKKNILKINPSKDFYFFVMISSLMDKNSYNSELHSLLSQLDRFPNVFAPFRCQQFQNKDFSFQTYQDWPFFVPHKTAIWHLTFSLEFLVQKHEWWYWFEKNPHALKAHWRHEVGVSQKRWHFIHCLIIKERPKRLALA